MKLATLNDGSRDGQLVVVSRDLTSAHYATGIANHLQQVLEDWNFYSPQLQDLYDTLNHGKARHAFAFEPSQCLAPLPRAYLFAKGDAFATAGDSKDQVRSLHLLFGDALQGPCTPLKNDNRAQMTDFDAGIAVITGDVAQAATNGQAIEAVRLLMLVNHVHLRGPSGDVARLHAAIPCSVFSPVAVTPDELVWGGESAWSQGRLNLTLQCNVNGRKLGLCDTGSDMVVPFGELISKLGQLRDVRAGSILSSGEVRNLDSSRGFCSIAARRSHEAAQNGTSATPWLAQGDHVLIDMKGRDGQSVFGAIDQQVHIGPQPKPAAEGAR